MAHAHVHVPEAPARAEGAPVSGVERVFELVAVVLLSLTTLATAWSGYQAARWSGEQSQHYARASAVRIKAQQQNSAAGQLRIDDLLYFDGWLNARQAGDTKLARIYQRRFRPEFVPAFRAWLAQRPFTNPDAIAGPLYMPEYRSTAAGTARNLDRQADVLFAEGTQAKTNDDRYILSTVFFAAVLFFAGISLRVDWRPLRAVVLGLAAAMLIGGAAFVATLPVA